MKTKRDECWKFTPFKQYWNQNKTSWWIIAIFLLIAYGITVFNVSISHDTEAIIAEPAGLYVSWYSMGRFGLIFLKRILGTYIFNPYVASFLMVLTMFLNSVVWMYFFSWLGQQNPRNAKNSWVFPVIFFTSTIVAEQSGFLLQAYEVNVALLLVGLALLNIYKVILWNDRWYCFWPSVLFCILAFSSYQTLVPLFTVGAASGFLLMYDTCVCKERERVTMKFCWSVIGKLIAVFAFSFGLYMIINKVIIFVLKMQTPSYITGQILWGGIPVLECIKNILRHVYRALVGKGLFYSSAFAVACTGLLVYALVRTRKRLPCYVIYILAAVFCMGSPFMLTIFTGEEPTARTQLLLPFVTGVVIWYLLNVLDGSEKKIMRGGYIAAMTATVFLAMNQSLLSARLFYTQQTQYEEDVRLAVKISDRIDQLNLGEQPKEPVLFVGKRTPQQNKVALNSAELSLIGKSFFEVSFDTKHGTWVMNHFMDTIGYSYSLPSSEDQYALAEEIAEDMPVWPYSGSVAAKDGIIVVRLG